MKTEKDCHELLGLFASVIDSMFLGVCAVGILWLLSRKRESLSLFKVKFKKSTLAIEEKLEVQEKKSQTCETSEVFQSKNRTDQNLFVNKAEGPEIEKKNSSTQTDCDFKWTAVWVSDDSSDEIINDRHRSEVFIDFATGEVSRKEEVFRSHYTHIIAPLK